MQIKFIKNEPALKVGEYLVIADLHLGITSQAYKDGISLPSQAKPMMEKINKLLSKTKTKHLIINGDIKHKVPGTYFQEEREIPELLANINAKITIVKGNHDGNIENLTPSNVKIEKEFVITNTNSQKNNIIITHGNRKVNISKYDKIIIGHNHPMIKFKDKIGNIYKEPAWIVSNSDKIIIMPSFNKLTGGHSVNEELKLIGPVAKSLNIKKANAFLLDGTDLGQIKNLIVKESVKQRRRR